jgi:hypothetical protein
MRAHNEIGGMGNVGYGGEVHKECEVDSLKVYEGAMKD